jgi:hypothetical protein
LGWLERGNRTRRAAAFRVSGANDVIKQRGIIRIAEQTKTLLENRCLR